MWKGAALTLKSDWLDVSFNAQLSTALGLIAVPESIAVPNERQPMAESDADRDLTAFAKNCEVVCITPWHNGTHSGNKHNMNWFLSAQEAQAALADQIAHYPWEGAVCFCVLADDIGKLVDGLEGLSRVIPNENVLKALAHAEKLSVHDKEKLFISQVETDQRQMVTLEQFGLNCIPSKQNIEISRAVASDVDPSAMLNDFKNKRTDRLVEVSSSVLALASQSGPVAYVLNLVGPDLADDLSSVLPVNEHAPLCCILAVGGENDSLAPLREVLSL